jgi:hypothetical protein
MNKKSIRKNVKKAKQEIIFNHIEIDEPVFPEFIAGIHNMVAEMLFKLWLKERNHSSREPSSASQ